MKDGKVNIPTSVAMVTIPKAKYIALLYDQQKMRALEGAGVDNWDGYSYAMEDVWDPLGPDEDEG